MIRLVGIPWGNAEPPKEANCLTLVLYAQKLLWGREIRLDMPITWTAETLRDRSYEIETEIVRFAKRVDKPEIGDIGLIETCGFLHLITFVEVEKVLHTILDSKSRISRYKGKGASIWRVF